jgi:hypothetical protein
MKQRSLNNTRPVIAFVVIIVLLSLLSKGGWGFSDEDWPLPAILFINVIVIAACLFFEDYIAEHRLLLIFPYTIISVSVFWLVQWHLSSVHSTFNIVVVFIGMLGALPGGILYYLMVKYFDKKAEIRFEEDNPGLVLKRISIENAMSVNDRRTIIRLHESMVKIATSKNYNVEAVKAVVDFVNANAGSREQSIRFLDMYDAIIKRDLINDIYSLSGKKNAEKNLAKFIALQIAEPVKPFKRKL